MITCGKVRRFLAPDPSILVIQLTHAFIIPNSHLPARQNPRWMIEDERHQYVDTVELINKEVWQLSSFRNN